MKAKKLEQQYGMPLKDILIAAFQQHNTQQKVADELGVSQGTISLWARMNGLIKTHSYILPEREMQG